MILYDYAEWYSIIQLIHHNLGVHVLICKRSHRTLGPCVPVCTMPGPLYLCKLYHIKLKITLILTDIRKTPIIHGSAPCQVKTQIQLMWGSYLLQFTVSRSLLQLPSPPLLCPACCMYHNNHTNTLQPPHLSLRQVRTFVNVLQILCHWRAVQCDLITTK